MIKGVFARFVVRPEMKAIIGWDNGVFEKGVVYEARELLGEIIFRKLGPSSISLPLSGDNTRKYHCSNGQSTEMLMSDGNYLLTISEMEQRNKLFNEKSSF